MKWRGKFLVGAMLLTSAAAVAGLAPNTVVYIKAKNTKLLLKPDATSKVDTTLNPGDKVKWLAASGKEFHQVSTDSGKTGYVYFSNLSTRPPEPEYLKGGSNTPVSGKAFADSGAATKALGEGAMSYGQEKLRDPEAVTHVLAMEQLADSTTDEQVAAHARKLNLSYPVVSPSGTATAEVSE